jgi:hypothetical protein
MHASFLSYLERVRFAVGHRVVMFASQCAIYALTSLFGVGLFNEMITWSHGYAQADH